MQDLSGKVTGSDYTAAQFDDFFTENKNQVESGSQPLSEPDPFQLSKSVANYVADGDFYTDGGSANNYIATIIAPRKGITIYRVGTRVRFIVANTNTGASTINVNTLGVKDIKDAEGRPLKAGQLLVGRIVELVYNGTYFILYDDGDSAGFIDPLPKEYQSGCLLDNNSGDLAHDLDISIGEWRDTTNSVNLKLLTAFTKKFDATWVKGSGNGGMASGVTLTNGNGYYIFLVGGKGKDTDVIGDSSLTGTNILADANIITEYGVGNIFIVPIHWIWFTGGAILPFNMRYIGRQRRTYWKTSHQSHSAGSVPTFPTSITVHAPPESIAIVSVWIEDADTFDVIFRLTPTFVTSPSVDANAYFNPMSGIHVQTDTLRKIHFGAREGGDSVTGIWTEGFIW